MDVTVRSLTGCPNATTADIVNCLKTESAEKMAVVATEGMIEFYPVLEDEVFTDTPLNMLKQGNFQKNADLMAGFTYVEGFLFAQFFCPDLDIANLNISTFR